MSVRIAIGSAAVLLVAAAAVFAIRELRSEDVPREIVLQAQAFGRDFGAANRRARVVETTYGRYRAAGSGNAVIGAVAADRRLWVVRLTGEFVSYGPCERATNYPARRLTVVDVLVDGPTRRVSCWNDERPPERLRDAGDVKTVRLPPTRPRVYASAASVGCLRGAGSLAPEANPTRRDYAAPLAPGVTVRLRTPSNEAIITFAESVRAARAMERDWRRVVAAGPGVAAGIRFVERRRNVVVLWEQQPGSDPARWVRECLLIA